MTSVLNGEWFSEHPYNHFGKLVTIKKGQTIEISETLYHLSDSKLFRVRVGFPNEVHSFGIVNCPDEINLNLEEIDKVVSWQETSLASIPEQNKVKMLEFLIKDF